LRTTIITLLLLAGLCAAASGGPDNGGYYWFDQGEGAAFFSENWTDISGDGSLISAGWGDDDFGFAGGLGWTFRYYGETYTDIYVSENGAVVFENTNPEYFRCAHDDHFPDEHTVDTILAPFWSDLNISDGGAVYYQDFGDRFVVMWDGIDYWGHGECTFELICWRTPDGDNSDIAFLYDFTPHDDWHVVGLQGDAATGTELQYMPDDGDFVQPGDWYLLTPDADYFGGSNVVPTSWGRIKALD
jgi:hypothetical protein